MPRPAKGEPTDAKGGGGAAACVREAHNRITWKVEPLVCVGVSRPVSRPDTSTSGPLFRRLNSPDSRGTRAVHPNFKNRVGFLVLSSRYNFNILL